MSTHGEQVPRILQLARRIEDDIAQRQLQPGDAYLATQAAARMLGVGNEAANSALQLLVRRGVLRRRQGKGAVVADPAELPRVGLIQRVHLLVHRDYLRTEGMLADGVVLGLQDELPGADLQFNFMPAHDASEYVRQLIDEIANSRLRHAFVLVRAPLVAQRLIQASGLPAVVYGTLYPSVDRLATVDRDQRAIGSMLVEHLIGRGHRRIAVLMRQQLMPGDIQALDAVRAALLSHGCPPAVVRAVPADREATVEVAGELLAGADRCDGFVCRSVPIAEGVAAAVTAAGMSPQTDVGIVACDFYGKSGQRPPFPCDMPTVDMEEIGRRIGRLLARQARGELDTAAHEEIPLSLEFPPNFGD